MNAKDGASEATPTTVLEGDCLELITNQMSAQPEMNAGDGDGFTQIHNHHNQIKHGQQHVWDVVSDGHFTIGA